MNRTELRLSLLLALLAFLLAALPRVGHAQMEAEAARQVRLAQADLVAGNFERALSAASSALRLDPLQYEAMVIKALAYEKLGEPRLAWSLLVAYQDLTRGMEQHLEVAAALGRLEAQLGSASSVAFDVVTEEDRIEQFVALNQALPAGPSAFKFTIEADGRGADFTIGLAEARLKRGKVHVNGPVFEAVFDGDKLVARGEGRLKLPFDDLLGPGPHSVEMWFDGERIAFRVGGVAVGPVSVARPVDADDRWFVEVAGARVTGFSASPWRGNLLGARMDGKIDGSPIETGASSSLHVASFGQVFTADNADLFAERLDRTRAVDAVAIDVKLVCERPGDGFQLRIPDGRSVALGAGLVVKGQGEVLVGAPELRCTRGSTNDVTLRFAPDGAVHAEVNGTTYGPAHAGPGIDGGWQLALLGGARVGGARVELTRID